MTNTERKRRNAKVRASRNLSAGRHPEGCRMVQVEPGSWHWLIRITCPRVHTPITVTPETVDDCDANGCACPCHD